MRTSSPEQWLKRSGSGNGKCLIIRRLVAFCELILDDETDLKECEIKVDNEF
jgi:hypothetical protein